MPNLLRQLQLYCVPLLFTVSVSEQCRQDDVVVRVWEQSIGVMAKCGCVAQDEAAVVGVDGSLRAQSYV